MEETNEPLPMTDIDTLAVLADEQRRRVLACIQELDESVSEAALAATVGADDEITADAGWNHSPAAAGPSEFRVELHHVHLPALDDAGLVDWDRSAGTVRSAPDLPVDEGVLQHVLASDVGQWDDLFRALDDPRRRAALSVLAGADPSMTRADLAAAVAARERDGVPDAETVRHVEVALQHLHLPVLEEAGLVTWRPDEGTVTRRDDPELDGTGEPSVPPRPALAQARR